MIINNGKRIIKRLDSELVNRYALVSAECNKLEKAKKALRDDIVLKMRGKDPKFPRTRFVSPEDCPFLLSLTYQQRSQMDWKAFAERLLLEKLGSVEKVVKVVEQEVDKAGFKRIATLLPPKANPAFIVKQATAQAAKREKVA